MGSQTGLTDGGILVGPIGKAFLAALRAAAAVGRAEVPTQIFLIFTCVRCLSPPSDSEIRSGT